MKRKLPRVRSDRQAERLVQKADLTQYDLTPMQSVRFEFSPKESRVNMRIPDGLLQAVKSAARRAGMPYQRFIRQTLEQAVSTQR